MYILRNAITSILRNKGRNILIGIIILVISCSVSITLAINNSSNKLIESYKKKFEVEATISFNRENMMKDFNPQDMESSKDSMKEMFSSANNISEEDIEKYAESDYVTSYYYTISAGVDSNIEKAEMTSGNSDSDSKDRGGFFGGGGNAPGNQQNGDFTLKGYNSIESMTDFIEGNYKITDGEISEDFTDDSCLINSELATLNDLKINDTITIIDPDNEDNTHELKIVGIFEEKTDQDNGMSMFSNSANTIITNTTNVKKLKESNEDFSLQTSPTFVLKDESSIEKFEDELYEKGLDENLSVQTNLDQVENATSTISNVKTFAVTFLVITLIIGTVVLLVINMINIRERKYEIGVLRTIGMKKSKVCLQFISELLIVSLIALVLGAGLGATMSVPISNNLLKSEIESSKNSSNDISENFGKAPGQGGGFNKNKFNGVAQVQAYDSIDAVVDYKVLAELLIIGLSLTLISSVSAVTSIQKFSPLEILKERT